MKKLSSFTLIETIIALGVTSLIFHLIFTSIKVLNQNQRQQYLQQENQIAQFLQVLNSDELQFQYKSHTKKRLNLYSGYKKDDYQMVYKNKQIVLKRKDTGYMPLLYQVDQFKIDYQEPYLKLTINKNKKVYQEKVVMERYEQA
ncbi:competence type IV pilus minor pilin ComGF [Ligilactobacillus ceti]|uniref:competence type IV pilus minor pilin ComGF n=1 Tax=Ligilactobacillus ceti TaxID=395085 RepID=UPI000483B9C9|nr:competence type IV pilus minor pilin ComGF [Ligilactobacillus ceti]